MNDKDLPFTELEDCDGGGEIIVKGFETFKRIMGRYPNQEEVDTASKKAGLWAKGIRFRAPDYRERGEA